MLNREVHDEKNSRALLITALVLFAVVVVWIILTFANESSSSKIGENNIKQTLIERHPLVELA